MGRKTETKIQSKYQLFVVLFKFKIVAVDEKFTVFNFCPSLFQICDNRKAWPPPASAFQNNWFIRNLQTTHGAIRLS